MADKAYIEESGYSNYCVFTLDDLMVHCRAYLRQIATENKIQSNQVVSGEIEEEDFKICSAINDEWNAEVAMKREIRLAEMREERENMILQRLLRAEKKEKMQKEKLNELVKEIKKESVTYITAENVDNAIEKCLANVVDYNRALDLEGNWHEGKYSPVPPIEETQKPAVVEHEIKFN